MLGLDERLAVIEQFTEQVLMSGYSREQTVKIVTAGLVGYENMKVTAEKSGCGLHKNAAEGAVERRRKKLIGKSSWFKSAPKSKTRETGPRRRKAGVTKPQTPVSVLFVSQTPLGALAGKLKELEIELTKLSGEKVKIVERSGSTIKQLLIKSNPWSSGNCGRSQCHPCKTGDGKQTCQQRNVLYETFCLACKEASESQTEGQERLKVALYVGESARTARERLNGAGGHLEDYRENRDKSHMFKHWQDCHSGEKRPEFGVKVIKSFTSCLMRQLWESVRIRRRSLEEGVQILNSKGEYSRCSLPRLVVEDSYKSDKKVEDPEKDLNESKDMKEEKKQTAAKSDTNTELEHSVGKFRRLETKTNRQKQKLTDIRKHFDRGHT